MSVPVNDCVVDWEYKMRMRSYSVGGEGELGAGVGDSVGCVVWQSRSEWQEGIKLAENSPKMGSRKTGFRGAR